MRLFKTGQSLADTHLLSPGVSVYIVATKECTMPVIVLFRPPYYLKRVVAQLNHVEQGAPFQS